MYYSPYTLRTADSLRSIQLGTADYEYHYMDWYQIPKLLDLPYWSDPYFDTGGGEMLMTTYSRPLHDHNGKLFAVFTADHFAGMAYGDGKRAYGLIRTPTRC